MMNYLSYWLAIWAAAWTRQQGEVLHQKSLVAGRSLTNKWRLIKGFASRPALNEC